MMGMGRAPLSAGGWNIGRARQIGTGSANMAPAASLLTAAGGAETFHRPQQLTMEDRVLVDHRSYRVKPGKLVQQCELYAKHGFPAQLRHLGEPIAYLQSES